MGDQPQCVDCKTRAPETATNYTLIGSQHGWRVTRTRRPDGSVLVEWRCASCWKAHKQAANRSSSQLLAAPKVDAPVIVHRAEKRKTSRPPPKKG
jgi:hypothetical protein